MRDEHTSRVKTPQTKGGPAKPKGGFAGPPFDFLCATSWKPDGNAQGNVQGAEWSLAPTFQYAGDRKFFTLPNEIFLLNLLSSAFKVYAYLLLIEDRKTHTCHPSYNTIAAVTGLAKNTVIKSINNDSGDGSHRCGAQQLFRPARDEVDG